jgi:tripeptide aminopeptidase
MQSVSERFLTLITYNTQANDESTSCPSTETQISFGKVLVEMCGAIGLSDTEQCEKGYVTATLPANTTENLPVIGFLAHMDTSPDAPGGPVKARLIKNYDGADIPLNENILLSPREFPHLSNYINQDLIVTDGNTLLGADNKAGIAEILTAMEYLIKNPEIKHGKIRIAFTPDEEIGRGADFFDVTRFGADYAYTIDGGEIGELESENFNAARAVFTLKGKSVHPGTAYKVMCNAALIANEIINAFPPNETPSETQDRQGFYHLTAMSGEVGEAKLNYILRDFESEGLEKRKIFVQAIADKINNIYGAGTVTLCIKDEYRNMGEVLVNKPEILERARQAILNAGIKPIERPIRGGTDGARLSFMGLPCPNIFTGGHNAHGPYEYIPVPSMEAAVKVIVGICAVN